MEAAETSPARWTIGLNVPWTVAWTGEQFFDLCESDDFPGLVDLVQAHKPGVGSPKFAAQHVTRHRRGMADHLCHVCGQPTSKHDRFIFPVHSGGFVILPDESTRYAGNIPPVHLACARRAQKLCPHLTHSCAQPLPFPTETTRLVHRTDIVPGMEAVAESLPPGLKVVFSCYRLYGPRFTRHVRKLRQKYGEPC